jgi:hypothetical protein
VYLQHPTSRENPSTVTAGRFSKKSFSVCASTVSVGMSDIVYVIV